MSIRAKAEGPFASRMPLARAHPLLQKSCGTVLMGMIMPEALVRGVRINYEVIGDRGPWIALTPGSRRSFGELVDLSKAIAASGFRVLLHDRRNCGASDVAFDGSGSEHEIWADDLYALGKKLDALPMYVGRSSAGARLAILYAMRHPDGLRGLLLWRLTGGQEAVHRLAENYYGQY